MNCPASISPELPVPDRVLTHGRPVDRHLVGRFGEHHGGLLAVQERLVGGGIECAAAQ